MRLCCWNRASTYALAVTVNNSDSDVPLLVYSAAEKQGDQDLRAYDRWETFIGK